MGPAPLFCYNGIMKVTPLKQFSVFMPNRPGALSRLAQLFSEKGVNMLGIASEVRDDSGMVRIAVDAKSDVSSILSQNGFASVETSVLSVEVENKAGELFKLTRILADAKLNITTVYGTSAEGPYCRLLVAVENVPKALALLEKAYAVES